jgi:uncharacterized protein YcbX
VPSVAWLSIAPVKGLGLLEPDEIHLEAHGVTENRRFYLIDENGRKINQKDCGILVRVRPRWDEETAVLALAFPDGGEVEGTVEPAEHVVSDFYGGPVEGRLVPGPWSAALSQYAGRSLRLVQALHPGGGVDRAGGSVTLLSTGSLEALGETLGAEDAVDPRRFRMLIGVDGTAAHAEDAWIGRPVRIGEAVVRPLGHVGRCAVTTQNPETGRPDLDTLKGIRSYRGDGTEPIPFGVWGEVAEPGRIRLGDPVEI